MEDSDKPQKKTVSTRITKEQHDRLTNYCEDHELSQADALRRFIRAGLDDDGSRGELHQDIDAEGIFRTITIALLLLILGIQTGIIP